MINLREFGNIIINLSDIHDHNDVIKLINPQKKTLLLNYPGKLIVNKNLLKKSNIFVETFGWNILFNKEFSLRWISEKQNIAFVRKNKKLIKKNIINFIYHKLFSKKINLALEKTFLEFFKPFFRVNFFIKILKKKK